MKKDNIVWDEDVVWDDTTQEVDVAQKFADYASKFPAVGGVATAGLGNVFEALRNPTMRDVASKTSGPVTSAMTGHLPAYLAFQGMRKFIPRVSGSPQVQGMLGRLPEGLDVHPAAQMASSMVKPELSGISTLLDDPRQAIKGAIDATQTVGEMFVAGVLEQGLKGGFKAFTGKPKIDQITQKDIAELKAKGIRIKTSADLRKLSVEKHTAQAHKVLKDNNAVLQKQLAEDIQREVPKYKEGFNSYYEGFNKTYGSGLDNVAKEVGGRIQGDELSQWANSTLNRLEANPSYVNTEAFKNIHSKLTTIWQDKQNVPFKDIHAQVKSLLKGRVYDGKSSVENLVYDEVRHSWGDFVSSKSASFAPLQAEARKVLELKRFGSKIFKPFSQYNTGKLESLLNKNASGTATLGEKSLLNDINKIMTDSGVNFKEIQKLASDIQAGKLAHQEVTYRSKMLINQIKSQLVKKSGAIKSEIAIKAPQVKPEQLKGSKLKVVGRGIGRVLDVAWRVMLYKALRGGF
jgi:hypothetical protein